MREKKGADATIYYLGGALLSDKFPTAQSAESAARRERFRGKERCGSGI